MNTTSETIDILGYDVFSGTVAECADAMVAAGAGGARECRVMACLNPHSYAVAREDTQFNAALYATDWLLPDGAGVVMAARWLGRPLGGRVTGPDTFMAALEKLDARGGSVFFLGSTEEVLTKIRDRMARDFPKVTVAGTYSPPYKPSFSAEDNAVMIAAINATSPDLLWVGMTAPKQEKWLIEHRDQLQVGVAGAVGAAFDFFAGTVKRSPAIFRKLGLEWLPRLVQQPRRLWRRMFVSAPIFLLDVYRETRRRS
jgi:N-acetylglucosaminyldiphosphoundecaprenol N-acetyl-beta-D-mannosaminyltransferase